jgi:hypothetical protein
MPLCQTTNTLGDIPVASKHQGLFVLFSHPCSDDVLSRRNALSSCTWSFSTFFLHGLSIAIKSIKALFNHHINTGLG